MSLLCLSLVLFLGRNLRPSLSLLFCTFVCFYWLLLNILSSSLVFELFGWDMILWGFLHEFFCAWDSLGFFYLFVYGSQQSLKLLLSSNSLCVLPHTCRTLVACVLDSEVAAPFTGMLPSRLESVSSWALLLGAVCYLVFKFTNLFLESHCCNCLLKFQKFLISRNLI